MNSTRPSCKYWEGCGNSANCSNCPGFERKQSKHDKVGQKMRAQQRKRYPYKRLDKWDGSIITR